MNGLEKHNVLVITLGGAPGVVTETVFALLDQKPAWVPHEIHLVTTTFGASDWRDPAGRPMSELRAVFAHFHAPFVEPKLLVPTDNAGKQITDIRTEEENIPFANELTWLVQEIKERRNADLHMSMAGGRKTMSSYSHAAMQYFAEETDDLTHTLVEPKALEYNEQFFWPYQSQQEMGPDLVAANAKVALVPSPFVSLRPLIERIPFAKNNFDHWTLRERLQARVHDFAQPIRLNLHDCTVEAGGATIRLGAQEFALYRVLAAARLEGWPGVGPDGIRGRDMPVGFCLRISAAVSHKRFRASLGFTANAPAKPRTRMSPRATGTTWQIASEAYEPI